MDWHGLKRDWRIWLLILSLLVSISLIFNPLDPYETVDGDVVLKTNIKQGLDLQGGARVLITPATGNASDDTINQVIDTLRTRISAFGLQEMDIRPVQAGSTTYIQIELAGAETTDLKDLINRTGRFEARIPITVRDGDSITLGDSSFPVAISGSTVSLDGQTLQPNESTTVTVDDQDITLTYANVTETGAVLSALAFTGQDILAVDIDSQVSGVFQSGSGYAFRFQVKINEDAAERVRAIVQHFPKGVGGSNANLQGANLVLTLDENRVSSLGISNAFQDQLITEPVITGGADTREAAVEEMNELKSVLKSGALPVPIQIVSTNTISPTLGQEFLQSAVLAIIAAIIAVAAIVFIRYRDPWIAVPVSITGFSELVMIFGFAAAVGWTIDLPSIAGIIAAIGTGVDDQIIITDERGRERNRSLKERFKRAFFIIFTSAASTIGAMIPLTQIGAGAIQGFAITTIVGVIMGVLITRPAYARVLQYMDQ